MIDEALCAPARIGFRCGARANESSETLERVRVAVLRAKHGDRVALRFLYVRYSDNVYGYVRTILGDDHEAEDVTQQVFAKLITALSHYDQRGVPFLAWLLRVARNAAIDHLRANRAVLSDVVIDPEASSSVDVERVVTLRATLEALPEEQRTVVLLRHLVGLTTEEIARELGRSEGSVNGLHYRGRRALRHELSEIGFAPSTRLASA